MSETNEWLTIAQAAERLGIAERQARRYAARLPDSDRTLGRTPAGRERVIVRLQAISEAMQTTRRAGQAPDNGPDTDRTEDRMGETVSVPLGLAMVAQREGLERVISEQAARIADLQASVDHERAQIKQLHEALAREQMLRALPPPAPEVSAEVSAPEAAPNAEEPQSAPPAPAEATPAPVPEPAAPTFWERLGFPRRKAVQGSGGDGVN